MARDQAVTGSEHIIATNKVKKEGILRMAMEMGLITPREHECLLVVGDHKAVDVLAAELASWTLDLFKDLVVDLARKKLVTIE